MQRLCIGVLSGHAVGWATLLRQEGVLFEPITADSAHQQFSVVVAGDNVTSSNVEWLHRYLVSGGSVLCSSQTFSAVTGEPAKSLPIKYVVAETGVPFDNFDLLDLYTQCYILVGANRVRMNTNQLAAFAGEKLGGFVVSLPFDPSLLVLDSRSATKSFYATRRRLPFEHVSLVTKGNLRTLVARSLEILHHWRGLPYIHAWYHPLGEPSIFSFRIDTDYAGREDIERLYNIVHRYSIPATWFVDARSQEQSLSIFKQMKNQEIAIHCYEHKVYDSYEQNLANIQRAIDTFGRADLSAEGSAAPYGCWNDNLGRAIKECGFEFSSEFSYDYDNLPSFPMVGGIVSPTLQVPVHPVSIGSLRRQGFAEKEMIDYFHRLLDDKLQAREPIVLYHHPKNRHEHVLEYIFKWVHEHAVRTISMIDYARWWKKRWTTDFVVEADDSSVRAACPDGSNDVWMRISRPDGRERVLVFQTVVDLAGDCWQERPKPSPLPSDIHRIRKFNPWIPLVRLEDYVVGKLRHRH